MDLGDPWRGANWPRHSRRRAESGQQRGTPESIRAGKGHMHIVIFRHAAFRRSRANIRMGKICELPVFGTWESIDLHQPLSSWAKRSEVEGPAVIPGLPPAFRSTLRIYKCATSGTGARTSDR